jgi:hypothetical protein
MTLEQADACRDGSVKTSQVLSSMFPVRLAWPVLLARLALPGSQASEA